MKKNDRNRSNAHLNMNFGRFDQIRWFIGYVVSDTTTTASSVLHCFSADQATGIHPAEVTSWYCESTSTGSRHQPKFLSRLFASTFF